MKMVEMTLSERRALVEDLEAALLTLLIGFGFPKCQELVTALQLATKDTQRVVDGIKAAPPLDDYLKDIAPELVGCGGC
jgi:hypothetical protein